MYDANRLWDLAAAGSGRLVESAGSDLGKLVDSFLFFRAVSAESIHPEVPELEGALPVGAFVRVEQESDLLVSAGEVR